MEVVCIYKDRFMFIGAFLLPNTCAQLDVFARCLGWKVEVCGGDDSSGDLFEAARRTHWV